jgi:hypothetical protein
MGGIAAGSVIGASEPPSFFTNDVLGLSKEVPKKEPTVFFKTVGPFAYIEDLQNPIIGSRASLDAWPLFRRRLNIFCRRQARQ